MLRKKLLGIMVLGLLLSGNAYAESKNLKLLNTKLLEIKIQMDLCINSKDKNICEEFLLGSPLLLEIYGNEDFAKLINSNKCQVRAGTKCGAAMSRIAAKSIQIMGFIPDLYE